MTAIVRARAPARVNIIGEHTDYNGGFVLPTCTALYTSVSATVRDDQFVAVTSSLADESRSFDLTDIASAEQATWIDYIKGVAAELQLAGVELRGVNLEIESDIPLGAGLSSSASLELSVARALAATAGVNIAAEDLAMLCQRAEHKFAGVQCGIMDQYTIACARKGHAILLDCNSMRAEQLQLPSSLALVITDSGVRHSLTDGDYNARADECATAVSILNDRGAGISLLREIDTELLEKNHTALGDTLYRRCRHVLSDNQRVIEATRAVASANLQELGELIAACHVSLRDDFEVSCPELDALVAAADASDDVLGSRMLGGGFGGCVLSVCAADKSAAAATAIRQNYARLSGSEPWQHRVQAAEPATVMDSQ